MTDNSSAQEARRAIERLYIAMRHLFNRGFYKPLGASGSSIRKALLTLSPEIYGTVSNPDLVELDGLLYVVDRLPRGIEECRSVKLISDEGYRESTFVPIIPPRRRRNCYRIDEEQMLIEVTRGRSEIYDILTHLTFLYIESEKIRKNAVDESGSYRREWLMLEKMVQEASARAQSDEEEQELDHLESRQTASYLSSLLGRTYEEALTACQRFEKLQDANSLPHFIYWLGKIAIEEYQDRKMEREVTFSSALRNRIGNHIYGEMWSNTAKAYILEQGLIKQPLHIISANPHSVMNTLFAYPALEGKVEDRSIEGLAKLLATGDRPDLQEAVYQMAVEHGMKQIIDSSGTNITLQIFDTSKLPLDRLSPELGDVKARIGREKPVILVMDYAFGEQAYETMDELLKPYETQEESYHMNVTSVAVMGKAGILEGDKGDIMIPDAHIFEGTADNYPFTNRLSKDIFEKHGMKTYDGPMVTVLGTSLQNKDVLEYFQSSSWYAVGLEMEGAHYQKAIQAHALIRKSISPEVELRYAYYASDNPLKTGSTLASGPLGQVGVKPTYMITLAILIDILT